MNRRYIAYDNHTFNAIAEQNYRVRSPDGRIVDDALARVIEQLQHTNFSVREPIEKGTEIILPQIADIEFLHPAFIQSRDDMTFYAGPIADAINKDHVKGFLYIADPARTIEELGFEIAPEIKSILRKNGFGVTAEQKSRFEQVRNLARQKKRVSGINSVRLRPKHLAYDPERFHHNATHEPAPPTTQNPIGGFDMLLDLSESKVGKLVQVAYDEGVIPHRKSLKQFNNFEIVIGRPTQVSFDSPNANTVLIQFPFALPTFPNAPPGELRLSMGIKQNNFPNGNFELGVDADSITIIHLKHTVIQSFKTILETELKKELKDIKIPLTPLLSQLTGGKTGKDPCKLQFPVADLDFKIVNDLASNKRDSLLVGMNFDSNSGAGQIKQAKTFSTSDWGIGINERLLRQKFDSWWKNCSDAKKLQRLDKAKLEDYGDLADQLDTVPPQNQAQIKAKMEKTLKEAFDSNGDLVIDSVEFQCHQGYIEFEADVTNEVDLWFDQELEISGKIVFSMDSKSHKISIIVSDIDISLSCWSKFVNALFGALLGIVCGGLLGAIIGGVIGGSLGAAVGISIALSIGTTLGGIAGSLLPAIIQSTITQPSGFSHELFAVDFDWQIPNTMAVFNALGTWVQVENGEVLLGGSLKTPVLAIPKVTIVKKVWLNDKTVDMPWTSAEQKKKLGGSPYYMRDSAFICSVNIEKLLEKPLTCTWKFAGQSIKGQGEKIHIIVNTKSASVLKRTGQAGATSIMAPANWTIDIEPGIEITTTIQLERSDGTKTAPVIFKKTLAVQPYGMGEVVSLEVFATDILGQKASVELELSIGYFGDKLADAWKDMKKKYEQLIHPDDLIGIPDEKLMGWLIQEPIKQIPEIFDFKRMELAVNIEDSNVMTND